MTISENDNRIGPIVPANGIDTISLDFYLEDEQWLVVYKVDTLLLLGVDYTVSGEGTSNGVITLTTPANGTDSYTVTLSIPLQRLSDMQFRGGFQSRPFNVELDRVWQAMQMLRTSVAQALVLVPSEGGFNGSGQTIYNIAYPTNANEVVIKQYVDDQIDIVEGLIEESYKEMIFSATEPNVANYKDGVFWYETGTARTFALYNDGVTREWILQSDPAQALNQVMVLRDQRSTGTAPQTAALGAWTTRELNTTVRNTIVGGSRSGNAFSLPVGSYRIRAQCQATTSGSGSHIIRLFNNSTTGIACYGPWSRVGGEGVDGALAVIDDYFDVTDAAHTYSIQHFLGTGLAAFGTAGNAGGAPEIYTNIVLERIF